MLIKLGVFLLICSHSMDDQAYRHAQCNLVYSYGEPDNSIMLSWLHSVEKSEWVEFYIIENNQFYLKEVKLKGSGAGMEIPPDAVFKENFWVYYPEFSHKQLALTYSPFTPDYQLCIDKKCLTLFQWMNYNSTQPLSFDASYRVSIEVFSLLSFRI